MRYPALTSRQSMDSAKVSGAAVRWANGGLRDRPRDEAVAALRAITTDPTALGDALGPYLADVELPGHDWNRPVIDLLYAAGADEAVAQAKAAWVREACRRRAGKLAL